MTRRKSGVRVPRADNRGMHPCHLLPLLLLACAPAAQDRATRVRNDRQQVVAHGQWIYDDLERGLAEARQSGKPLVVVLRCIPCEACRGFDEQVAELDPRLRELLERFVRVRIPKANGLDLGLFQQDWDVSFSALFLAADRTVYGRFGSRVTQQDKAGDASVGAFREALEAVLDLHARQAAVRDALAGKRPGAPRHPVPEQYPALAQYQPQLDWDGKVVQSCIHCHQIRGAEFETWRARKEPIPERTLFAWPEPAVLGLELDPARRARVLRVTDGSAAAQAGFRAGDDLRSLAGQPLVSIADVCWVLETAGESGTLAAQVLRDGKDLALQLPLAPGWRARGDISWRATTWDLRRIVLGGMFLVEATDAERKELGVTADQLALRAQHVGEYGQHATALRAGARKGDFVVAVDGHKERRSESQLIAALQRRAPGAKVEFTLRRGKEELTVGFALQ